MKVKSIWLDMDDTLMNWSKGDIRKALMDIEDPDYYRTLELISIDMPDILYRLKKCSVSLNILSGIPDYTHCYYVPIFGYEEYYERVRENKQYTLDKYFKNIFETVIFTKQSESKARIVQNLVEPETTVFIDDMEIYIKEWKRLISPYALLVTKEITCRDYLLEILHALERR